MADRPEIEKARRNAAILLRDIEAHRAWVPEPGEDKPSGLIFKHEDVEPVLRAFLDLLGKQSERGWPEITVGAESPPHSPVDRYRCENDECESYGGVWEFRPDDYDLDESAVNCPACGEEGEMFFRWFRGGRPLAPLPEQSEERARG